MIMVMIAVGRGEDVEEIVRKTVLTDNKDDVLTEPERAGETRL